MIIQGLNWLYQNDQGQQGHLEARIHVFDGRLWVDRGGGGMSDFPRPPAVIDDVIDDDDEEDDDWSSDEHGASALALSASERTEPQGYRDKDLLTSTVSQLIVDKAQMYHSGRYICSTRATAGTWTLVHILAGWFPPIISISCSIVHYLSIGNSDLT